MDLTYLFDNSILHLRARGVIFHEGRLLVLRDLYHYWYQVGGRISYGESSRRTLERELHEELHLDNFRIGRPLFCNEHTVFRNGRNNQEFVIYYEVDISETDLLSRGLSFTTIDDDDDNIAHEWRWLKKEEIEEYGFYPAPLLDTMFNLPERFELISTHEDTFRTTRDLTFNRDGNWLNLRVASVFVHDDKLLAMKDGKAPFFYLPGGRIHFGESPEEAIEREVGEEVQVEADIIRPLRISENFFESVNHPGEMTHEWCFYFLMEVPEELLKRGNTFITHEEQTDIFEWIPFGDLPKTSIMPPFLGTEAIDVRHDLVLTEDRS